MNSKERLVYFNGKFIHEQEAKVSIYDSALMFGDMVFEMTRSFRKNHFKLKEHIDRLFYGLKILKHRYFYPKLPILADPTDLATSCRCMRITLREGKYLLYELCPTGGKPSTWFPPEEIVEQNHL